MEIKLPYSANQHDALIDCLIYNQPYGVVCGEMEYIDKLLKEKGYNDFKWFQKELDDKNYQHIIELSFIGN